MLNGTKGHLIVVASVILHTGRYPMRSWRRPGDRCPGPQHHQVLFPQTAAAEMKAPP